MSAEIRYYSQLAGSGVAACFRCLSALRRNIRYEYVPLFVCVLSLENYKRTVRSIATRLGMDLEYTLIAEKIFKRGEYSVSDGDGQGTSYV